MNETEAGGTEPLTPRGLAVIIGASGGIGRALLNQLQNDQHYSEVLALSRNEFIPIDLLDEQSIASAAQHIASHLLQPTLIIDATGTLSGQGTVVEKSWRQLDPAAMAQAFAVNAVGPALLMKHFLPLLPRDARSVFATLSARVGSIGDNHLGGWYSYRASKAALNQIVRTAAIELKRSCPRAVCVAIHPGTVDTDLSRDFAKKGLDVQTPELAAARIVQCLDGLRVTDSGGFFDQMGRPVIW